MKQIAIPALLAVLAVNTEARAVGSLADVAVIDRDSGATLETHWYRGEYWVAGSTGARYALAIRNRLGERVLAVAAVDGINIVSGETAGWDQTGYVFNPGQRYEITGWRKSDAEVTAFAFTPSPDSYAARTGRPANVGVIGVALFRERSAPPPIAMLRDSAAANRAGAASREAAAAALPSAKLGTAHGERESSLVGHTEFVRQQSQPDEIIRIRYDSLDHLIAMGIVTRPRPTAPIPDPFPGSAGYSYVPDPPG
jgi:hypothetical protein